MSTYTAFSEIVRGALRIRMRPMSLELTLSKSRLFQEKPSLPPWMNPYLTIWRDIHDEKASLSRAIKAENTRLHELLRKDLARQQKRKKQKGGKKEEESEKVDKKEQLANGSTLKEEKEKASSVKKEKKKKDESKKQQNVSKSESSESQLKKEKKDKKVKGEKKRKRDAENEKEGEGKAESKSAKKKKKSVLENGGTESKTSRGGDSDATETEADNDDDDQALTLSGKEGNEKPKAASKNKEDKKKKKTKKKKDGTSLNEDEGDDLSLTALKKVKGTKAGAAKKGEKAAGTNAQKMLTEEEKKEKSHVLDNIRRRRLYHFVLKTDLFTAAKSMQSNRQQQMAKAKRLIGDAGRLLRRHGGDLNSFHCRGGDKEAIVKAQLEQTAAVSEGYLLRWQREGSVLESSSSSENVETKERDGMKTTSVLAELPSEKDKGKTRRPVEDEKEAMEKVSSWDLEREKKAAAARAKAAEGMARGPTALFSVNGGGTFRAFDYVLKKERDAPTRGKRISKELNLVCRKQEREKESTKKRIMKLGIELRKLEEERKEKERQRKKLEFLLSQTELFSHFLGKKMGGTEALATQELAMLARGASPSTSTSVGDHLDTVTANKQHGNLETKCDGKKRQITGDESEDVIRNEALLGAQEALQGLEKNMQKFDQALAVPKSKDKQQKEEEEEEDVEALRGGALANPELLKQAGETKIRPPPTFTGKLKNYQVKGLQWLVQLYDSGVNGILADEMGLGKTVQTIALLAYLAEIKGIWGPFIVISPTSTLHNWHDELKSFFPKFKVLPYWGSAKDRKILRRYMPGRNWDVKEEDERFHVLVTSYHIILQDEKFFKGTTWQYMVLDEAQAIKSSNSARWKTLLALKARNRLLLTGTPIQNNMAELWSLLHFIMPAIFDSHKEFTEWFAKDIESHVAGEEKVPKGKGKGKGKAKTATKAKGKGKSKASLSRNAKSEEAGETGGVDGEEAEGDVTKENEAANDCEQVSQEEEKGPRRKSGLDAQQLARLHLILKPFMMRRLKKDVLNEMCKKEEHEIRCRMSARQSELYRYLREKIPLHELLQSSGSSSARDARSAANDRSLAERINGTTTSTASAGRSLDHLMNLVMQFRKVCNHPEIFMRRSFRSPFAFVFGHRGEMRVPHGDRSDGDASSVGSRASTSPNWWPISASNNKSPLEFAFPKVIFRALDGFIPGSHMRRESLVERVRLGLSGLSIWGKEALYELEFSSNSVLKLNADRRRSHSWTLLRLADVGPDSAKDLLFGDLWAYALCVYHYVHRRRKRLAFKLLQYEQPQEFVVAEPSVSSYALHDNGIEFYESCILTPVERLDRDRGLLKNFYFCVPPAVAAPPKPLVSDNSYESHITSLLRPPVALRLLLGYPTKFYRPEDYPNTDGLEEEDVQQVRKAFETKVLRQYLEAQRNPIPQCFLRGLLDGVHRAFGCGLCTAPDLSRLIADSGKLQRLDALLKRLYRGNHRCLIFSQSTKMMDLLGEYMRHRRYRYVRLDGSTSLADRRDIVAEFQTNPDVFVFLLSTRAGGLGINLTAADTVIFYDSDWNPTMDEQAMDRAHRLGQTADLVRVFRLITARTIEERILRRARQKAQVQKIVVSGSTAHIMPSADAAKSGKKVEGGLATNEVLSLLLDETRGGEDDGVDGGEWDDDLLDEKIFASGPKCTQPASSAESPQHNKRPAAVEPASPMRKKRRRPVF